MCRAEGFRIQRSQDPNPESPRNSPSASTLGFHVPMQSCDGTLGGLGCLGVMAALRLWSCGPSSVPRASTLLVDVHAHLAEGKLELIPRAWKGIRAWIQGPRLKGNQRHPEANTIQHLGPHALNLRTGNIHED